jgi:hypothetical protein
MTPTTRAGLVPVGVAVLTATYFAAIFIPVGGGCLAAGPIVDCGPIRPWATVLPIAIPLGVLVGGASLLFGLMRRRG